MYPGQVVYLVAFAINIFALVLFLFLLIFPRIRNGVIRFGFVAACICLALELWAILWLYEYKDINQEYFLLIGTSVLLNIPFFIAFIIKTKFFIKFWAEHKYKFIKK